MELAKFRTDPGADELNAGQRPVRAVMAVLEAPLVAVMGARPAIRHGRGLEWMVSCHPSFSLGKVTGSPSCPFHLHLLIDDPCIPVIRLHDQDLLMFAEPAISL